MTNTIKGRPLEIESQAPIIQELERAAVWAYATFAGDRRELPALTVTIQTRGKKHTLCGSFKAEGFRTKEGEAIHEIVVCAERLFEDPYLVLETIVHETVHLCNHDLDEKDNSKGGRHNQVFRDQALAFGLEVDDPYDSRGYGHTHLSTELRERLEKEFKPDLAVFRIFKEAVPIVEKAPPVKKQRPWVCKCPVTLQIATGVEAHITCKDCSAPFTLKDAGTDPKTP